jgi:hypothetical protein
MSIGKQRFLSFTGICPESRQRHRSKGVHGTVLDSNARGHFMATTRKKGNRQESATAPETADRTQEGQTRVQYDADALLGFYQTMVEIRLFEDAAGRGFRQGKIGGYLHVYSGQEPIAMGFINTMQDGDRTITAYRDHAHALLQGADPNAVMAELYGKGTGIIKGKGGSMHLFHVEGGMYGGYGIVGGVRTTSSSSTSGTDRSTTAPSTRQPTSPGSGARMVSAPASSSWKTTSTAWEPALSARPR